MTTVVFSHPSSLDHITPPGHPERPDRIRAVEQALSHEDFNDLERREAPAADSKVFELAHPASHIAMLEERIPETGIVVIDADTSASPKSWDAVRHSVGAALEGVDCVFDGRADNVFSVMRPPGHHAEKTTAMGFCFVNTIAIAARYAQEKYGIERVAIIDWDVHHGNGTQDIFYEDDSVLFASTHQMPLYPGTGAKHETGIGNIFNAPLSEGDGSDAFKEAFTSKILPAVDNFAPELILISAGFDAHFKDPLAGIKLVEDDFDWATGKVMELAGKHCDNRLVSLLEGGYDLEGLADSAAAHVRRLKQG
ncbi:MAG: acetoin utilization protein [Hyphomicrobiales bacterium]|nr:MAG: acetoin utilization protein [Hyphomicrobiales bacterium]